MPFLNLKTLRKDAIGVFLKLKLHKHTAFTVVLSLKKGRNLRADAFLNLKLQLHRGEVVILNLKLLSHQPSDGFLSFQKVFQADKVHFRTFKNGCS